MSIPITYTSIEWFTLAGMTRKTGGPALTEPELPARIANEVGRAWLARQRDITISVATSDAALLAALRSELPDIEVLTAIATAERIIREHALRPRD